ncbi:deoxynucleoside kinase [Mycoplasmoides pneumoniae]|uniref:Uncharacterized protein MG268 homolog n=4 Tax=Mycoplasmoides pneumoniae TaxID=2104 RepID=Y386_MYCPN|nr:deoxynucleoside kinase [Mycoplasmoides pneumoniae]P75396.1 RecName: Full=Uncharacterized protein MG268 homolog [Mycoplasmoides pneumoniae M129]AAB96099.1 deoxyguanosine kinase/deoxyadenosine kinase [Mycoplasmoides pneumoniae M129]ADK87016.1 conserved hypothetical protein [Mycoplasmoides pneumoniae FH]AGC04294.1 hypothetical protein C985_0389 [Mycoplasmoides pneumoniae M129-B7]ALA30265.1 hypothetical protein C897_02200 [Mycoplasmoides pneumoniae PI 1428]ALA31214.1 hypothetical protein B434_
MKTPLKPKFQPAKIANAVVVGGMIAFGKTTIAESLAKHLKGSKVIYELEEQDQLADLLLAKMYERNDELLYAPLFQLYFTLNRFNKYRKECNNKTPTIFDRSIFEDWLFAKQNIHRPSIFTYYNHLWNGIVKELIFKHGIPALYVILEGDWELFEQRLFQRNRKVEIDNFAKNKDYFKNLYKIYGEFIKNVCYDFGISHCIVNANQSVESITKQVLEVLKSKNLDWEII